MEQVVRAAVERGARNNVVTNLGEVQDCQRLRCLATADEQCSHATLEGSNALLDDIRGRIHDARVDVAHLGQAEESRSVIRIAERVRGGCVDRQSTSIRCRIRCLTSVHLLCFKTPRFSHVLLR